MMIVATQVYGFIVSICVSTNQNGMLLVLVAYITEVQRQSSSVCSVHNVV